MHRLLRGQALQAEALAAYLTYPPLWSWPWRRRVSPPHEEIEEAVWYRVTYEAPPSHLFADGAEIPLDAIFGNDDEHFAS